MIKSTKGFTLVELLAAFVIFMIIVGIALPVIGRISESNKNKQIKVYADSMIAASKLYVDSNSEDMFGNNKYGCAYISYDNLFRKNLIKDYTNNNLTANNGDTYVKVIKSDKKYKYHVSVNLINKSDVDNVSVLNYKSLDGLEYIENDCGVNASNIRINADPSSSNTDRNKKAIGISISLSSYSGINSNYVISYGWGKTENDSVSEWTSLNFNIPTKQESKIENAENIIAKSTRQVVTPQDSSDYYLFVRVDELSDYFSSKYNGEQIVKFGPYSVDNTPPEVTSFNIVSTNSLYNSKDTKLNIKAKDNYSSESELKYCIVTNKIDCTKSSQFTKKLSNNKYSFSGDYDGSVSTLKIKVMDLAGNISKEYSSDYTRYQLCSTKILKEDWKDIGTCSKACGEEKIQRSSSYIDKYLDSKCPGTYTEEKICENEKCKEYTVLLDGNGSGILNQTLKCTDTDNVGYCNVTLPNISVSNGWNAIGWNTNGSAQKSEYSQNSTLKLNKNMKLYAITKKSVTLTFNYKIDDNKDFNKISGNKYTTYTCDSYNGNLNSCKGTAPKIALGKNQSNQSVSDLFSTLEWRDSSGNSCLPNSLCETLESRTYTLYLKANSNYINNNKLYAYSPSGNTLLGVRFRSDEVLGKDSTDGLEEIGVTCSEKDFIWNGEYGVATGDVWLRGYTNYGFYHKNSTHADSVCKNIYDRTPKTGTAWSSATIISHR